MEQFHRASQVTEKNLLKTLPFCCDLKQRYGRYYPWHRLFHQLLVYEDKSIQHLVRTSHLCCKDGPWILNCGIVITGLHVGFQVIVAINGPYL